MPQHATRSLELHIEEIVLTGFDPRTRHELADAIHEELKRLVANPAELLSLVRESRNLACVDAGSFPIQPSKRPAVQGRQIAGAIYKGLISGGGNK